MIELTGMSPGIPSTLIQLLPSSLDTITPADVPMMFGGDFKISVGNATITKLASNYAEGAKGEVFAILGSGGFLEISVNKGSAAQVSGAGKGSEVVVTMS